MAPRLPSTGVSMSFLLGVQSTNISISQSILYRNLIYANEWYFYPGGVVDVKTRFQRALQQQDLAAKCEWDNDNYVFQVQCYTEDYGKVESLFRDVMFSVIREEERENGINQPKVIVRRKPIDSDDSDSSSDEEEDDVGAVGEDDPIKSQKIQRLLIWMTQNKNTQNLQLGGEETSDSSSQQMSDVQYPSEIKHYKSRSIWLCQNDLDEIVPDGVLRDLTRLTGCHMVRNLNEKLVYIGGHAEENVDLAISKLDNLLKYSAPRILTGHSFYGEDIAHPKVSMKYLTDVKIHKKKFYATTLLDNLDNQEETRHFDRHYGLLHNAVTVRCALKDPQTQSLVPHKKIKVPPVVEDPDNTDGSTQWKDFNFSSKGESKDDPMRYFSPQQRSIVETSVAAQVPNVIVPATPAMMDTLQAAQITRWANQVPETIPDPIPPTAEERLLGDDVHRRGSVSEVRSKNSAALKPDWDTYREYGDELVKRNEPMIPKRPEFAHDLAASRRPIAPEQRSLPKQHSLLDDSISVVLPSIWDPIKPISTSQGETRQAIDEVQTRKFHRTMNQKAPKPKNSKGVKSNPFKGRLPQPSPPRVSQKVNKQPSKTADPVPGFCEELDRNFAQMLQDLRGFKGQFEVQAEFGRIIILGVNPDNIAGKEMKDHTMEAEKVARLLGPPQYPTAIQPHTYFTNKLTTIHAEIDFLVNMKDSEGNELWGPKSKWDVIYQFMYYDQATSRSFVIEIDGETFSTEIKTYSSLGCLYVHGTKRHWDFRIEAKGAECGQDLRDTYGSLEAEVKKSLYIPAGLSQPKLCFEISNTHIKAYRFDGIRVHRITRYSGSDSESMLKVSQIDSLVIKRKPIPNIDREVFIAYPHVADSKVCQSQLGSWYEVGISSTKADDLFKQNKSLELGSEAGWTPESISRLEAARSMYLPACGMLKQMDGIGYHNDHGVGFVRPANEQSVMAEVYIQKTKIEKFW
ncbi:hypothetical protein G7Y89_g4089 [Cudoniella acicularis]|uniref:Uncharacterized protein n=1 Tax=Cudoniella acicularis TaxID=354080 RepID=A0A8H4RSA0_9HELO|nr:hypothetical protein G7Y89_g4089 [Cudoniella acicularis]